VANYRHGFQPEPPRTTVRVYRGIKASTFRVFDRAIEEWKDVSDDQIARE
jgi:hypothetical protein